MNRTLACITVVAALSLLAVPSAASARATAWGGSGFNDLGSADALLSVNGGRASLTNVQLILACTDAEDGTESSRAFDAQYRNRVSLDGLFAFDFTATSGGRVGRVRGERDARVARHRDGARARRGDGDGRRRRGRRTLRRRGAHHAAARPLSSSAPCRGRDRTWRYVTEWSAGFHQRVRQRSVSC